LVVVIKVFEISIVSAEAYATILDWGPRWEIRNIVSLCTSCKRSPDYFMSLWQSKQCCSLTSPLLKHSSDLIIHHNCVYSGKNWFSQLSTWFW
jgi:hypothetical protein